jgi:hypothetical protein
MSKRIQKTLATGAAVSALALGGAVFAQAQSGSPEPVGGPDRDSIQQGDQTTPDKPATKAAASQTTPDRAGTSEKPGTEKADQPGAEKQGAEQPGAESAPNSRMPDCGKRSAPAPSDARHSWPRC